MLDLLKRTDLFLWAIITAISVYALVLLRTVPYTGTRSYFTVQLLAIIIGLCGRYRADAVRLPRSLFALVVGSRSKYFAAHLHTFCRGGYTERRRHGHKSMDSDSRHRAHVPDKRTGKDRFYTQRSTVFPL